MGAAASGRIVKYTFTSYRLVPATEILFLVPARGGSKRLPGKNLKLLAGKSLLEWTADTLRDERLREHPCLLTTDDPSIAEEGLRLDWLVPWLRPDQLAADTTTSLDTALHALDWWHATHGIDPEIVVLLQVTTPIRRADDVAEAIGRLQRDRSIDAVIAAKDTYRTAASLLVEGSVGLTPLGPGGSGRVITPNGSFYAIRPAALRSERTFLPRRLATVVMDDIHSIDIDTALDFALAQAAVSMIEGPITR